ncbi:MAG: NAD(P)H-dependent oxidoreductase subunit E [Endomicrobium sp.]|jgi:NADH-quinone oxidoreductase E subunit|nr:NAD(P)H-dependent oxidoreductase subunit E [Endomicrobium sp.]
MSDEKLKELQEYIQEFASKENKQSYLIAVLHKAQSIYGYLPKEVIEFVSEEMRLPTSAVWGAATFYNYFHTTVKGKYIISVCMGTACYVKGAVEIMETIKDELEIKENETTQDMMFTLQEARCLGACGLAPVLMVNGKVHGDLTPEKVKKLINDYRSERL